MLLDVQTQSYTGILSLIIKQDQDLSTLQAMIPLLANLYPPRDRAQVIGRTVKPFPCSPRGLATQMPMAQPPAQPSTPSQSNDQLVLATTPNSARKRPSDLDDPFSEDREAQNLRMPDMRPPQAQKEVQYTPLSPVHTNRK